MTNISQLLAQGDLACTCGQHHHTDLRFYEQGAGALRRLPELLRKIQPAPCVYLCFDQNLHTLFHAQVEGVLREAGIPYAVGFANDERFKLFFRGRGYDRLSEYIAEKKIRNVNATGEFAFSKTLAQYFDADVILCMYGNGSPYWDYALANKLYFAAQLGLPILVCEKTAMADMTENFDLGIAIDLKDDKAKERIIRLFEESNVMRREQGRYLFLKEVEKDNARTFADIRNFFNC